MTDLMSRDYLARLRTLGIDKTLLFTDATGLIGRAREAAGVSVDLLPALRLEGAHAEYGPLADLRLGEIIGEGGMGAVLDAHQLPLRRRVAVKRLHTLDASPSEQAQLMQEALVLGALEHPNIVPVYALGRGPDGRALLVMKRIEGRAWSAEFERLYPTSPSVGGDRIDAQLRIFLQICNAVNFAHGKGVVHRDLKPANVMIGAFGEVYVVDWGIAVSIRADAPCELEPAASVQSVAGTPAYMAPEMAAGFGDLIDERTDVYLLGAILHELITGRAPHEAPTVLASLEHAFLGEPFEYDASVPLELATITRRAMSYDPEARFASAAALHDALLEFLAHRASDHVCAEALACLGELSALLANQGRPAAIHERASAARFGFQQALRSWTDNATAREGLQNLLELMIARELDRGDAEAALLLIGELPEPRPTLEAAHAVLRRTLVERQNRIAALERQQHDADPTFVASRIIRKFILLNILYIAPIITLGVLRLLGLHRAGYADAIVVMLLLTAASFLQARDARRNGATLLFRNILDLLVGTALLSSLAMLVCAMFKLDMSVGLAVVLLLFAHMMLAGGAYIDPSFYVNAVPLCLAAIAVPIWPAWRGLSAALAVLATLVGGYKVWTRLGARLAEHSNQSNLPPS